MTILLKLVCDGCVILTHFVHLRILNELISLVKVVQVYMQVVDCGWDIQIIHVFREPNIVEYCLLLVPNVRKSIHNATETSIVFLIENALKETV